MPQAPGSLPNNRIGESDLRAFAKAYIEFEKIRGEYEPKLNTANTPQEKGAVEQEAVAKLNKAVENEGLTMQQYGALYQTVSVDPQLREKILRLIDEERGKS
jgi:rubrerythrin